MDMAKSVEYSDGNDNDGRPRPRLEITTKLPCGCSENNHRPPSSSSSSSSCFCTTIVVPSAKNLLAFFAAFLLAAVIYSRWTDTHIDGNGLRLLWNTNFFTSPSKESFTCTKPRNRQTCGPLRRPGPTTPGTETNPPPACPEYFRWIHEDLRPWRETGITRDLVESARRYAHFRLVVVDGRAYVQHYAKSFQTRDLFTLWGIVQLLRLHGGRLPDLDLMFDCNDTPRIRAGSYAPEGPPPPPLFRYCGDNTTVEIVFPDWSFWGWPETNIKPWGVLLKELKEGNRRVRWLDREPYAFWKGNPWVSTSRRDLLKCNPSKGRDWKARLFTQDWGKESKQGFRQSNLAGQCTHRYKIYIEGASWSVSEKYILACDSPTLFVKPRFYDFFSRGLLPLQHYWPINNDHKCSSIHFAVDWCNNHTHKAQLIGKEGSNFIEERLAMGHVYDYMFHILNEYSKLLNYTPTVPAGAVELCTESMVCPEQGLAKDFMLDSMVNYSSRSTGPSCTLPPPMDHYEMEMILNAKAKSIEQVEAWEQHAPTDPL